MGIRATAPVQTVTELGATRPCVWKPLCSQFMCFPRISAAGHFIPLCRLRLATGWGKPQAPPPAPAEGSRISSPASFPQGVPRSQLTGFSPMPASGPARPVLVVPSPTSSLPGRRPLRSPQPFSSSSVSTRSRAPHGRGRVGAGPCPRHASQDGGCSAPHPGAAGSGRPPTGCGSFWAWSAQALHPRPPRPSQERPAQPAAARSPWVAAGPVEGSDGRSPSPWGTAAETPRPQPPRSSAGCEGSSCLRRPRGLGHGLRAGPRRTCLSLGPSLPHGPSDLAPRWAGDSIHRSFLSGRAFPLSCPGWAHDIEKGVKGDVRLCSSVFLAPPACLVSSRACGATPCTDVATADIRRKPEPSRVGAVPENTASPTRSDRPARLQGPGGMDLGAARGLSHAGQKTADGRDTQRRP